MNETCDLEEEYKENIYIYIYIYIYICVCAIYIYKYIYSKTSLRIIHFENCGDETITKSRILVQTICMNERWIKLAQKHKRWWALTVLQS
jgi:hypothetical protein